MSTFSKGQRVMTDLGAGVIAGFERFDKDGMTIAPADEDDGQQRVLVQLDEPSKWVFHNQQVGLPHFPRRELQTVCSSTDTKE